MRLCIAQTRPVKGDIQTNIDQHKNLIALAIDHRADVLVFPELSLTGYEPALANELDTDQYDSRLSDFQEMADNHNLLIGVGMPTKNDKGTCISLVLFTPNQARQAYSKEFLHPDEDAFFVSGQRFTGLVGPEANIALAICYELSIPQHLENACKQGARIYMTSVAKSADGVSKASDRLADIAKQQSMTVLMANCLGLCDNFVSAGQSAIWTNSGVLVGQLDDTHEGILLIDTETQKVIEKYL